MSNPQRCYAYINAYDLSDYSDWPREPYGRCEDRYGISWQVVPANIVELLKKPGAFGKMMNMKKLVIAEF